MIKQNIMGMVTLHSTKNNSMINFLGTTALCQLLLCLQWIILLIFWHRIYLNFFLILHNKRANKVILHFKSWNSACHIECIFQKYLTWETEVHIQYMISQHHLFISYLGLHFLCLVYSLLLSTWCSTVERQIWLSFVNDSSYI